MTGTDRPSPILFLRNVPDSGGAPRYIPAGRTACPHLMEPAPVYRDLYRTVSGADNCVMCFSGDFHMDFHGFEKKLIQRLNGRRQTDVNGGEGIQRNFGIDIFMRVGPWHVYARAAEGFPAVQRLRGIYSWESCDISTVIWCADMTGTSEM